MAIKTRRKPGFLWVKITGRTSDVGGLTLKSKSGYQGPESIEWGGRPTSDPLPSPFASDKQSGNTKSHSRLAVPS